jgi:hypothetical protein
MLKYKASSLLENSIHVVQNNGELIFSIIFLFLINQNYHLTFGAI